MTRQVTLILMLLSALGIAVLVGMMHRRTPEPAYVTCRPTAPGLAAMRTSAPVVLLWGNSLLFDAPWAGQSFFPINCAHQGMTAEVAVKRTELLPDIAVDAIVLAFGSVELIREADIDTTRFAGTVAAIRNQLADRYGPVPIIVSGVPSTPLAEPVWGYLTPGDGVRINRALRELDGAVYLDLSRALADVPSPSQTYDGIHLTAESYMAWEQAIMEMMR